MDVILGTVALTPGLVVAILALTVAVVVATGWLLGWFDPERRAEHEPCFGDEPAWWPEFERQFEDYLSSRD